jgi:hypothetical protein
MAYYFSKDWQVTFTEELINLSDSSSSVHLYICLFIFQGPPGSTGPPGPGTPIMPSPQGEPEVTSTLVTSTPGSLSEQDAESWMEHLHTSGLWLTPLCKAQSILHDMTCMAAVCTVVFLGGGEPCEDGGIIHSSGDCLVLYHHVWCVEWCACALYLYWSCDFGDCMDHSNCPPNCTHCFFSHQHLGRTPGSKSTLYIQVQCAALAPSAWGTDIVWKIVAAMPSSQNWPPKKAVLYPAWVSSS